jgi:hypothetical protein
MDKEKLRKQADWSSVAKRATWSSLTTKELSVCLDVPHQSVANWCLREQIPAPQQRQKGHGNKNRYRLSEIMSWLYGIPEDDIHWKWINEHMSDEFESIEQAMWNAKRYWKAFGIEQC